MNIYMVGFLPLFIFFFISIFSISLVNGQLPLPIIEAIDSQLNQAYIVHVQKPISKKFHFFKQRKEWYRSFLSNNTLFSGEPRLIYAYRQVITGFSAWLTKDELAMMELMDGFLLAYPNRKIEQRTTYTPKYLGLERVQGMWFDSEYGQGQVIAVIDTGVKPTHPSFRDRGMPPPPVNWNATCYWGPPTCNNKIIGTQPNGDPLDDEGHGTHVASIASGNFVKRANVLGNARGTASGIAPRAHLAIYKSSGSNSILKSIDDGILNHVDVITISLGDFFPDFNYNNIVIGAFSAATNRIVVCAAAPNNGPRVSRIDNDAPWMITVGAGSTNRRIVSTVRLGDGREFDGESAYQLKNYKSPKLPIVNVFDCFGRYLKRHNVTGKLVLCNQEGNNTKTGKDVLAAGASAMIIISNLGNTTLSEPHVLPVSHVTNYAGKQIQDYSTRPKATASIIFKGTRFGFKPSPEVGTFSGRGPSLNNGGIIKPDVIAPGINILAAWPFEVGLNHTGTNFTFSFQTGTSMATPHVAGLAALLKHNHPTWSAAAIKSAIMTTASATDLRGNPILDQKDGKKASVFAMGSGYINPLTANDPGLVYDTRLTDYTRYLCGLRKFSDKQVSAIVRGNITCSNIRKIKSEQLNYPSIGVSLSNKTRTITVSRTVTNVGNLRMTYNVDFKKPKGVNIVVSPVVLRFNKISQKKRFNVTLSFKTVPLPAGEISEGVLSWVSGKYLSRIPIAVSFVK